MNPRVLTLIGNGHQHNLSPTTNLTPGEKNDILHLLKKNKKEGRQKYSILLYKEHFTCVHVLMPHFAKFIKVSMENLILLSNKTFYHVYVFHACPLVHGQSGTALYMKTRSDYQEKR